jgi:hypothetical protein
MSCNDPEWYVGQEVAVFYYGKISRITKVERLTKTLVILKNGDRFKKNGFRQGDTWYNTVLYPLTDDIRREYRHLRLVDRLAGMDRNDWQNIDTETLEKITAILNETKKGVS